MPQAKFAGARFHNANAALTQHFKVGLRRRVVPHIHVHGRRHQHRRLRSQVHCAEKIVGNAVGKLGQNICCGRSNNQRIGPLRLANVLNAVLFV